MKNVILLLFFLLVTGTTLLMAQEGADIESAALAVERMLDETDRGSISEFMEKHMPDVEEQGAMMEKILSIRKELKGLRDDISLNLDEAGAILTLSSGDVEKRLRIQYDSGSRQVTDLLILPPEEKLTFSIHDPEAAVQFMIDAEMAGVLYLQSAGKVMIKQPFGMANEQLGVPNSTETIFAIGSRPIDFTKAAILLLEQEGRLSLDDTLGRYLKNVPRDKQAITLRHLMTGASGLPDFFHNEKDWDPDLQWVSRAEAIQRMLEQKLLFEPGKGNSHSHGAFGLLAAIVEIRSGKSYMAFLEERFFLPAGMKRAGEYGDKKDFELTDFAVGGGPQFVGLPNIPPNWGPTSWLIKGSGGMYATLDDLLKFYQFVRESGVFDAAHARYYQQATADLDGSMRGFELFSAYNPPDSEIFLFLNKAGDPGVRRKVFLAFEALVHK